MGYKKIIEFIGRVGDWQKWKLVTECSFYGSGYEHVLSDALFVENNPHMNPIVYSELAVATIGDTSHYLVKIFKDTNNGNSA